MKLTQNQADLMEYFKAGHTISVKGRTVTPNSSYKYRVQRNTVLSLHKRGLIKKVGEDNDEDIYGIPSVVFKEDESR